MKKFSDLSIQFRRFTFRHRRPVAAALMFVAVLSATTMIRPDSGATVVVAAHDLEAGAKVSSADLDTMRWPGEPPDGFATSGDAVVGEIVATPILAGEPMTDSRIRGQAFLAGYAPDAVVTTIRIADPTSLTGVRVGDTVAVVGTSAETSEATYISRDVRVLSLPDDLDEIRGSRGASIQVITNGDDALTLAEASMNSRLTLVSISRDELR